MSNATVHIYTDGSADNQSRAGTGAHIEYRKQGEPIAHLSLGEPLTDHAAIEGWKPTNNNAELLAVVRALDALIYPCAVTVYTDSKYVADGWNTWLAEWQANGWKTTKGSPVKNRLEWEMLIQSVTEQTTGFTMQYIERDSHPGNKAAHQSATEARKHGTYTKDRVIQDRSQAQDAATALKTADLEFRKPKPANPASKSTQPRRNNRASTVRVISR